MILVFQYLHLNMSVAMTLFMASSYKMPVVCSEFNHNRYKMIKWNYLSLFFYIFTQNTSFFFSSCIFIWFYAWAQYHLMEHAHRIRLQHKSTITITSHPLTSQRHSWEMYFLRAMALVGSSLAVLKWHARIVMGRTFFTAASRQSTISLQASIFSVPFMSWSNKKHM